MHDRIFTIKELRLNGDIMKLITELLNETDRSKEELDIREKMIARIEGYFGSLTSLWWHKLSTEDMTEMYQTLVDNSQIKKIKQETK